MKTIIFILISMITTVFYAQTPEELESFNYENNIVLSTIPSLAGKDYFILDGIEGHISVISKINDNYTYYNLELKRVGGGATIIYAKAISFNPVLNKIFTNFVPKTGVKRYLSDYGYVYGRDHILGIIYFAIYKNGVKTFDYCLPALLESNSKESPIDDETLVFLYVNVLVNPGKL